MKTESKPKEEKLDWFPLNVYEYLTDDLAGWTSQQVGAYTILLCHQWINGSIPGQFDALARIVRESTETFKEIWGVIACKFDFDATNSKYVNNKLELVRQNQMKLFKTKSISGSKGAEARWSKFVKPGVEEVRAFCTERKNKVDPQAFVSFYESKDWMIGKNKMKNWKQAIITWERGSRQLGHNGQKASTLGARKDY